MRAALVAGGLVAAGCLGAYGAVEAQKYPIAASLWSTVSTTVSNVVGARTATTGTAAGEAAAARPQSPSPVTTTGASPVKVAAAPGAPAPAAQATPAPQAAPAQPRTPMPKAAPIVCNNPNALGISRVVQIDTTGGPGFGMEHFRTHDFLNDHEVVLTFDDGPWLNHTPMVLKALADQCVRATFFPIGKHATYYPEILKQVAAAGHTVGSHTWSHKDLSKLSADEAKAEIEMGVSAVHAAVGGPTAPFFRFPALKHPPEMVTYLGDRNVAIFSADFDSFDFKMHKPEQVVKSVMEKLAKHGKGIILMHDFQRATAEALPTILAKLKEGGYKVVHMVPQDQLDTLPQYDEMLRKDQKLPTVDQRPTSSVVRTISE
ncbi:MAG TPA: polysaccharide deacetylase family protein [Xanthobacteraceae bacterium]|nr:polysaccharide deacetylase family protein [Xanthobacteraceae bacterium]